MTTKRRNRLRRMTFLNTHRLSDKNEDTKYQEGKQFIERTKDYFISISPRIARRGIRSQYI